MCEGGASPLKAKLQRHTLGAERADADGSSGFRFSFLLL